MRRTLIAVIALLPLAACGPKTIKSILFPTRYGVTTVVDFHDDGRVVRQTVVSRCEVIDQTDSVARNVVTHQKGESHWVRRADGSLWILGTLTPCRWGLEGPGERVEFAPLEPGLTDEPLRGVAPSLTYRIDDPAAPTRIDAYRTEALFDADGRGLRIGAQIAPVGDKVTDGLKTAFPLPPGMAAAKDDKRPSFEAAPRPARFVGLSAEVFDMSRAPCRAAGPAEPAPVRVLDTADCDTARGTRLGGLRPEISPDFSLVRFASSDPETAYLGSLFQAVAIQRAQGAGGEGGLHWAPEVCVDSLCVSTALPFELTVYLPARRQAVVVRRELFDLDDVLRPAP